MKKLLRKTGIALAIFCSGLSAAFACTDFRLTAQDGTVLITRSMEFAVDMQSNLLSSARGRIFNNTAPDGKPGLSWKAKYGYILLDGFNLGMAIDGMNEHGLSIEALYLPGETQYPTIPAGQENRALPYFSVGDWVLGNFKTIDEVKQAIANVLVFALPLPQANNMVFPLHFAIYDNSGKSIIVEFNAGKMQVYDNNIGIMTNSPTYPWHITNLRNFLNLSPTNPQPVIDSGVKFVATGQGAGMIGLPGDISPPSRFVKMAMMVRSVIQPANADDAVNMGQHIINNVDIPLGFVREAQDANKATNEFTQWVVFKDLTHRKIYYRTYGDMTLRMIDLTKINFAENTPQLKLPLAAKPYTVDMTQQFTGK